MKFKYVEDGIPIVSHGRRKKRQVFIAISPRISHVKNKEQMTVASSNSDMINCEDIYSEFD
jgi:hypothetical protein